MSKKRSSVERVKQALEELDVPYQFKELPHSTRTAVEAAAAVNSTVSQIVKSLVFKTAGDQAILILTSGSNQVDESLVSETLGVQIKFADADFVRRHTGFAIGGVSPYGLAEELPIYIDRDLLQHALIWAAAGSSHAVFSISPADLLESTGAELIDVHP
jgi:prolyl-tRNA editing enzyme YbaK/EbsC (Cys-tRNA(Pro) deacylase)